MQTSLVKIEYLYSFRLLMRVKSNFSIFKKSPFHLLLFFRYHFHLSNDESTPLEMKQENKSPIHRCKSPNGLFLLEWKQEKQKNKK